MKDPIVLSDRAMNFLIDKVYQKVLKSLPEIKPEDIRLDYSKLSELVDIPKPKDGKDYIFTDEDKQEIIDNIKPHIPNKEDIKNELFSEIEKAEKRFDSNNIRNIVNEVKKAFENKRNLLDSDKIVTGLLKNVVKTDHQRDIEFHRQQVFSNQIRQDFIKQVLDKIEIPDPIQGQKGEKGDQGKPGEPGKTPPITDSLKKEIAKYVDTTAISKNLKRDLVDLVEKLKSGKIKLPRGGGTNLKEIRQEIVVASGNIRSIFKDEDFPDANENGFTVLRAGFVYLVHRSFETQRQFTTESSGYSTLEGITFGTRLTYTGTSNFINNQDDGRWIIKFITLDATQNGTKILNIDSGSPTALTYVFITQADKIGTFNDVLLHINSCLFSGFNDGLTLSGTQAGNQASLSTNQFTMQNGNNQSDCIFMEFTGYLKSIRFSNATLNIQSNESALFIDPSSIGGGVINSVDIIGSGNPLYSGSKDQKDIDWKFNAVGSISDSTVEAEVNIDSNTLVTDILNALALTMVNANTWSFSSLERIIVDNYGVSKYIGKSSLIIDVLSNIAVDPLGINKNIVSSFTQIDGSYLRTCTFDSLTLRVVSTAHGLSTNDIVSFYNSAGTLPSELRKTVFYFVQVVNVNEFSLKYDPTLPIIIFTDNGSGSNNFNKSYKFSLESLINTDQNFPITTNVLGKTEIRTNDQIAVVVTTLDATNVRCSRGGYMISK